MRRIFLILSLMFVLFLSACGDSSSENNVHPIPENNIVIPDIKGADKEVGKNVLSSLGLVPIFEEEFSDNFDEGLVTSTDPSEKTEVAPGSKVKVMISQGRKTVKPVNGNWNILYVKGSQEDDFQYQSAIIEGNELIIKFQATFNSVYPMTWLNVTNKDYGYGNASTNASFSENVVLFKVYYEDYEIKKGSPQNIEIRIPLEGLGTNRPSKVYMKLASSINDEFEFIEIDFTFNW